MQEMVGRICINYDFYKGTDLYSDGDIEEKLLEFVQNHDESELETFIKKSKKWPVLYHFSTIRQNVVEWFPFDKDKTVLEIGSGCGAITGCLSDKCAKVTCVELSKRRSLINAYRNQKRDNIEIYVSNFEDFQTNNHGRFDYITLIGVFEYSGNYIDSGQPSLEFLKKIKKLLKKGGLLFIAIENKLGMKYWAGCKEDHLASFFSGIENYPVSKSVRTYTKKELMGMLGDAGFTDFEWYYPYPDYKFAHSIYSDDYLPGEGDLSNNLRNFDMDRLVLFDESKAFDTIIQNGLFPVYSNSYLVIAGGED